MIASPDSPEHPLPRHDEPLRLRTRVLQSCSRLGERSVEKNVRDSHHQLLQGMPDFPDLAALNAWLEQRCMELWQQTQHGTLPGTIADVWAAERTALMPLHVAFDGFIELSKRVSPTCLISFERNRYSVPASFANRPVSLRIYPDRLVVAAESNNHRGKQCCRAR